MKKSGIQGVMDWLLVLAFVCLATVPFLTIYPPFDQLIDPPGNLTGRFPILNTISNAVQFPERFEKVFNNNFYERGRLVKQYQQIQLTTLSANRLGDVLVGANGWLYWAGEGSLDDTQNAHPFTNEDLEEIHRDLASAEQMLAASGIEFIVVVAPNKQTIYPEFLPAGLEKLSETSRLDQVVTYETLQGFTGLLDLRSILLSGKELGQVYYRTDSHWNDLGAFLAFSQIVDRLIPSIPTIPPTELGSYIQEQEIVRGDLSNLLMVTPPIEESTIHLAHIGGPESEMFRMDRDVTITEQANQALPNAVIFHDSFINNLQPYLSDSFYRAVYVKTFTMDWDWISREQPDVVIVELAERYLHYLVDLVR